MPTAPLPLLLRPAMRGDAEELAAIYAPHVLTGTGTFEEVPPTPLEMEARMGRVIDAGWPWLVAERDGVALGYAYAAQFRERPGYRYTCEDSVYVRADAGGQGIGGALLDGLIEAAAAAGFRQMLAVIGDAGNRASIALHERQGFVHAGAFTNAGLKFGRWIDIVFMQRQLAELP